MKNKIYSFFIFCCMANIVIASNNSLLISEADPSPKTPIDINHEKETVLFTDPVINCPSNIVVTASAGQTSKTVNWNTPSATTPCVVSSGQSCASNSISGFKYLGKYGDSKYYCSNTNDFTYWEAKQRAQNKGGFLVNICNSGLNNFLKSSLLAPEAWIGLNDEASEGNFRWVSGATCNYRNWASGEPNNQHNTNQYHGADFAVLSRHDGKWRDRNGNERYEFIMEIPCTDNTRPGNVSVTQTAGPASGSAFSVGTTTTIRYEAIDECGRSKSCSFTVTINAPVDPCGNNGGDSDGDGICDNQDNCDFTPNPDQADNDGDGIGNACDDTPNGDPCANQGGDSDGDGVCDNQDNCDFTPNPDQADNDGDGIGNVCDDTPNGGGNGGDCNSVTVAGGDGKITITDIPSGAKVEISGPSTGWGQQLVCNGNCNDMEMVSNLSAGDYSVTVQTFNPYCYKQYRVSVTSGGGGNPCDGQGGDSDGDGICDNQDNCDFTPNPDQADNDGDGIGNVCDDTPNGGGNGGDCNSVTVSGSDGKVTITDIPSGAKVEISGPSTGYGTQLVCNANCNDMEMVANLTAGNYNVIVQTFNPYCYKLYSVTVTGGNPCDGQGGDSDGDGICDNQDNCDFTANPDQADNDGDGIGNVCDDTPNGDPCANNGGDSDGDGVCDNQDNCDFTANPNQADSDGDGIGDVCDNDPCNTQGGDSDGDGICNNQDNCVNTFNPDQADNDGDGIGNVCDDTPNGDPCANLGGDNDGDGVCAANDCDDNDPNVPNNLPCDDGCNQNDCTKYRGNVDFKAIGNSMNYAEDRSNCNKKSSSSANLSIPSGTTVKSATLYWSGSGSLDRYVKLNGNNVTASKTWSDYESSWGMYFFAASADVTNLVNGNGNYSVSSLSWNNTGNYCQSNAAYGAWSLVVVYEGGSTPLNTIQVCADDFRFTFPGGNYSSEIRCINVPDGCNPTGELTIIAFEGDNYKGENFYIEGQQQSGSNNFRGQTAPNLDIVTFNINNYLNSNTSKINYTIQSYQQNTIWGQAIEGLFDLVKIVKYGCGNAAGSRNAPMLDFAAFTAQQEVELQWATNTGYKNDYYLVEKSIDGSTFETIQRVDNLDFTDEVEAYNGIDPTPALGDNHYRIKQVYTDGSFDYTDVKTVNFNIDLENLSMYPNPAQDELNFNLDPIAGKAVNFHLINNFGQVMRTLEIDQAHAGSVRFSLDNIPNGFYQVMIQVEGQKLATKKLIVERLY